MNLRFWRKPIPVSKPEPKLSDVEKAILEDEKYKPDGWRHRRMSDEIVRSDRGAVAIYTTIDRAGYDRVTCGQLEFGPAFTAAWAKIAVEKADAADRAEKKRLADAVEAQLTDIFIKG